MPELHCKAGDAFIRNKTTYDAFHGTELLGLLQRLGAKTLIIAGKAGRRALVLGRATGRAALRVDGQAAARPWLGLLGGHSSLAPLSSPSR